MLCFHFHQSDTASTASQAGYARLAAAAVHLARRCCSVDTRRTRSNALLEEPAAYRRQGERGCWIEGSHKAC